MSATETIIPGQGWVLIGEKDADVPDIAKWDPTKPTVLTGFTVLGHTSKDNPPALSKDGGETELKDTWDVPGLRAETSVVKWSCTVNAVSVTQSVLELAFPGGKWDASTKTMKVPANASTVTKAVLILMKDAVAGYAGIYIPAGSIALGEAPSIATDGFFELQLNIAALTSEKLGTPIVFYAPREATPTA